MEVATAKGIGWGITHVSARALYKDREDIFELKAYDTALSEFLFTILFIVKGHC